MEVLGALLHLLSPLQSRKDNADTRFWLQQRQNNFLLLSSQFAFFAATYPVVSPTFLFKMMESYCAIEDSRFFCGKQQTWTGFKRWTSIALASQAYSLCLRAAESIQILLLHCSLAGRLCNRLSSLIRGFFDHTMFSPLFFVNGLPAAPQEEEAMGWGS